MTWWQIALIVIGYLFVGLCVLAIAIRAGMDECEFEDGFDIAFVIFWPIAVLVGSFCLLTDHQILLVAAKGILKIVLSIFYTIKALIFKGKGETK